jgi:hypothetical protein
MSIQIAAGWKNRLSRGLVTLSSGTELILEKLWHWAFPDFPLTQARNRPYQKIMQQAAQYQLRQWASLANLLGLDGATKRRLLPVVRHYGNLCVTIEVWHIAAIQLARMIGVIVMSLGIFYFVSPFSGFPLSVRNHVRPFFPFEISLIDVSRFTGVQHFFWQGYVSLSWLVYWLVLFSVMFLGLACVFFPLYVVSKRAYYLAGLHFGIGWPIGVIVVYLTLISLLAPIAKLDPLNPQLTQTILAAIVTGLGGSTALCSWFIIMLYGINFLGTFLHVALERRWCQRYPHVVVTIGLLEILAKVIKHPAAWGTLRMKRELVTHIEQVASCLENDLPHRLQSDIATDDWLQRMTTSHFKIG